MSLSALQKAFERSSPQEKLKFAKLVRDVYVREIGNTKQVLDPARLRALNENIALIESQLNGRG